MRKTDNGAIGWGGKRLLAIVTLAVVLVVIGLAVAGPAQAGLRERIEYREQATVTPVDPYPLIQATYTPGATMTPYPTPETCWPPFLCLVR